MAKKVTINGSNLLSSIQDAWGGQNTTQYSQTIHGTTVPPGAEWGMNRGEVERFIKSSINAQQSRVGYYVCDNSASTAAKTVVASGYQLATGGCVRIKMTNTNTANNVTLNINSTGAKALYYNGAQASSTNTWEAGEVLEVYYDGTQYQCASGGGGGEFATGEKVKDISITDEITENSNALIESGAVYDVLYAVALDNSLTEGYYLHGTGSESRVADANWGYTDYIPAVNGDTIKSVFGTNVTTAQLTCVAYYNASKQFLAAWSAYGYNNSRDGMTINNANAAYIRANIYLPNKQSCGVYINGTQVWGFGHNTDGIQKQIDNINDEIDDFEETFAVTDDVTENSTSPISSGGVWNAIYGYRENALTQGCMKVNNNVFSIVSSTDWGYTDFIPASNGDIVDSIFGVDARSLTGIVCIAYFDSNKNYLAAWTVGGYNNRRSGMTINNENAAYIRGNIYLSSRENCAIYINGSEVWGYDYQSVGIEPRIGILETDVAEIDEKIDAIEDVLDEAGASGKVYLPLLSLINSDTSGGKISSSNYDTKRVVTKCATCFPVENMIWKVKCPTVYSLYVWLGNSAAGSFTLNEGGWIGNGLSFPTTGKKSYRVVFRKGDGNGALPVSEIQALVDSGDIAIYTEIKEESVFVRNLAKDVEVGALRRILISDLAGNGMNSMFMFGHLSDVHGDAPRMKNFLDYCDNFLDVVCVSGDSTMYQGSSDFTEYQEELAKAHDLDFLFCIGNHEAYPTGQSNLYGRYMQRLATEYSYLKAGDTVTDVCYWYKDYADKNIRIIAINYYEGGVYSGCLGQAQITWFINTLASTPAGYGVIVMLHSTEDKITVESPYDIFKQKHRLWSGEPNGFYVGDRPIMHIIDAFISKGTYTGSYTESTSESVTINADFSQVDTSTEFIAYVTGHLHEDWIGYYYHATNKQLCLGITTGNALYGDASNPAWSNQSDLPRGDRGTCQDAFNIYAIDRIDKNVKIVRIGADITETFVERKMMMIPYRDTNG